jgi:hypothetical protein
MMRATLLHASDARSGGLDTCRVPTEELTPRWHPKRKVMAPQRADEKFLEECRELNLQPGRVLSKLPAAPR